MTSFLCVDGCAMDTTRRTLCHAHASRWTWTGACSAVVAMINTNSVVGPVRRTVLAMGQHGLFPVQGTYSLKTSLLPTKLIWSACQGRLQNEEMSHNKAPIRFYVHNQGGGCAMWPRIFYRDFEVSGICAELLPPVN